jgi:hypothetical protein
MRFYIFLFLVSCGMEPVISPILPEHNKFSTETAELKSYVSMFERDSVIYGEGVIIKDLVVRFGDVGAPRNGSVTLAKCYRTTDKAPEVVVGIKQWRNLSNTGKMLLVYHELGHCVLNRLHINREDTISIMNPTLMPEKVYKENKEESLRELFDPSNQNDWLLLTFSEEIH